MEIFGENKKRSSYLKNARNLRNLRNYTVKLADVGCTKPKVDNINSMFLSNNDIFKG
jgi:hypothetical protein